MRFVNKDEIFEKGKQKNCEANSEKKNFHKYINSVG